MNTKKSALSKRTLRPCLMVLAMVEARMFQPLWFLHIAGAAAAKHGRGSRENVGIGLRLEPEKKGWLE